MPAKYYGENPENDLPGMVGFGWYTPVPGDYNLEEIQKKVCEGKGCAMETIPVEEGLKVRLSGPGQETVEEVVEDRLTPGKNGSINHSTEEPLRAEDYSDPDELTEVYAKQVLERPNEDIVADELPELYRR